jgi:hypothetical protein
MLKARFPQGYIVYDVINNHFLFLYNTLLIDAVHYEWLKKKVVPKETDFMVTSSIVVWDFFPLYDSFQYERIIKDCIE